MDESTLLKSAKNLDLGALVTIVDTVAPDVDRYAFRLYLDPFRSDYIVGDVFSQFLENVAGDQLPSFDLRVSIFQITYQKINDTLEDDQPIVVKTILSNDSATGTRPDNQERLLIQLLDLLKTELSAIQRHILLLRYLASFRLHETALIVGESLSNVKVIQNWAIAKFNRHLNSLAGAGQEVVAFRADP